MTRAEAQTVKVGDTIYRVNAFDGDYWPTKVAPGAKLCVNCWDTEVGIEQVLDKPGLYQLTSEAAWDASRRAKAAYGTAMWELSKGF